MSRLERLGAALEEPLLVTYGVNVRYLTGFDSSNCALLVEPGGATTLYTDFRYLEAAKAVDGVEVVRRSATSSVRSPSCSPGGASASRPRESTYAQWETLGAGGADLVPTRGVGRGAARGQGRGARSEAIRRACAVSDAVYAALAQERLVGRTEAEVAWWIERAFREHGAEGLAFEPIVASGENGSRPHAGAGDTVIAEGTLVTVDMGCIVDGYCSDCTRTFATGELPAQLAEAYALVSEAQLAGLAAVRAGRARPRRRRGVARRDRCGGPRRGVRPRPRPRRRARGARGAGRCGPSRQTSSWPETSSRSSRASTCRSRRLPDRGPRRRHRGRLRDPDALHEGAA